jgi:hypothetical protein
MHTYVFINTQINKQTNVFIYIYISIHTFIHTNTSLKETNKKEQNARQRLQYNTVNGQINIFKVRKTTRNYNGYNCKSHKVVY